MKYFIILVAFIIVAVVGVRIASSVMSREEPSPVTAIGAADGDESVLGPDRPDIVDTTERQTPTPSTDNNTAQSQTTAPLEQEVQRLQGEQDVLEQREELEADQAATPYDMEQRRLEEEQDLLEQQQAVIRERQELQELQAEQEQQAMPPMPGAGIKPVTEF